MYTLSVTALHCDHGHKYSIWFSLTDTFVLWMWAMLPGNTPHITMQLNDNKINEWYRFTQKTRIRSSVAVTIGTIVQRIIEVCMCALSNNTQSGETWMELVSPQQCECYGKGVSQFVGRSIGSTHGEGRTLMAGCVLVESLLFSPGMLPADLPSHL